MDPGPWVDGFVTLWHEIGKWACLTAGAMALIWKALDAWGKRKPPPPQE